MFYQLQLIKAIWISTSISMTKWPKAHRTRSPLALSTLCLRWKGQLWGFCRYFTRWHERKHRIKMAFHTTWDTDLLWFLYQRGQLSPAFPSRDPHSTCWRQSLWWLGLVPFPPCSKDWDSSAASAPATVRLEGGKYWNEGIWGYSKYCGFHIRYGEDLRPLTWIWRVLKKNRNLENIQVRGPLWCGNQSW